jgi:DNA invertase Pin-like site-specific DNA recombinase
MAGLETCRALGIDFVSVTESIDTSLPSGELVFQMIGTVAQFERSLIAERVKSGLANARATGKCLGRPPLRRLSRSETRELTGTSPNKCTVQSYRQEVRGVGMDRPQIVHKAID